MTANIIQQQEMLKDLSDNQIAQEMQQPSGQMPLFLISTEAKRRSDLRQRFKAEQTEAVRLEADSRFLVRQISRTGVLVEAELPLKQEEVIDLELRLGRRKFASTARVAHVAEIKVEDDNLQYRLGLEFIKTEQKYRDLLEDFIRGQVEEEKAEGTSERDE